SRPSLVYLEGDLDEPRVLRIPSISEQLVDRRADVRVPRDPRILVAIVVAVVLRIVWVPAGVVTLALCVRSAVVGDLRLAQRDVGTGRPRRELLAGENHRIDAPVRGRRGSRRMRNGRDGGDGREGDDEASSAHSCRFHKGSPRLVLFPAGSGCAGP